MPGCGKSRSRRVRAADEVIEQAGSMSAYGTKRTLSDCPSMSAFGGKADIATSERHVRF
jgi:hypothetical protein